MSQALPPSRFDYLNNRSSDTGPPSRIIKTRVTRVTDGDSFLVSHPSIKGEVRISGVDSPEEAHPEKFREFFNPYAKDRPDNIFAALNSLKAQPFADKATSYTRSEIEGKEVTLIIKGIDKYGRPLASVIKEDGTDINQELIKRGLGNPYFKGHPFHDPSVMTEEIEAIAVNNIIDKKGLYSNDAYQHPVEYKHGVLSILGSSRQKDLKQVAKYRAAHIANKYGVDNEQLHPLFDSTGELGPLTVPSRMGSSYFYAVALRNNMMRQAGYKEELTNENDLQTVSSLYRIAMHTRGRSISGLEWGILNQYDRELATPGLGPLFNEYVAIPLGMGRLYKDEVGLLPSIMGAIGSVLDRSYLYHIGGVDGRESLSSGAGYKEPSPGFFESALSFSTNFVLSSASTVALYLAVGAPLGLIMAESFKSSTQNFMDQILSNDPMNTAHRRLGATLMFGIDGSKVNTPADIKRAIIERYINEVPDLEAYYSPSSFTLTPHHMNATFFRQRGALLLDSVMRPVMYNMVLPFTGDSEQFEKFKSAYDAFILKISEPPDLVIGRNGVTLNRNELKDLIANNERLDSVTITQKDIGLQRQKDVAKALQGVLNNTPLPTYWKIFGGYVAADNSVPMIGNFLNLEKITNTMSDIVEKVGTYIDQSDPFAAKSFPELLLNKAKALPRVIAMAWKDASRLFNDNKNITRRIQDSTSQFRKAEELLLTKKSLKWNDVGDIRVVTNLDMDTAEPLFQAMAKYEKDVVSQGVKTGIELGITERIAQQKIQFYTSSTVSERIKLGIGGDPTLGQTKAKWGTIALIALDVAIVGNELFRSTSGVSLFTAIATAITTGKANMAIELSGSSVLPGVGKALGMPMLDPLLGAAGYGLLLGVSYSLASVKRRMVETTYLIENEIMDELISSSDYTLERVQAAKDIPFGLQGDHVLTHVQTKTKVGFFKTDQGYLKRVKSARGDIAMNTAIIFGIGVLASKGIGEGIKGLFEATRNITASGSNIFRGENIGSFDPILASIVGGSIAFASTKSFNKAAAIGLLSAGAATVMNSLGARFTSLSMPGENKVNPLNASAVSQLTMFKQEVKSRLERGEKVSKLELMAAFYGGELSKTLPVISMDSSGSMVQVIARQIPLPMLQIFMTETIKNRSTLPNGMPNTSEFGTRYYAFGIQGPPQLGINLGIQLPFKIYKESPSPNNPNPGIGISYNEQSNLIDLMQSAAYIAAIPTITTAVGRGVVSALKYTLGGHQSILPALEEVLQVLDNIDGVFKKMVKPLNYLPALGFDIVHNMASTEVRLANQAMSSLETVKLPLIEAASNKLSPRLHRVKILSNAAAKGLTKHLVTKLALGISIGAPVGSILGQLTTGSEAGSALGWAGGLIATVAAYHLTPWYKHVHKEQVKPSTVAASTSTGMYNASSPSMKQAVSGSRIPQYFQAITKAPIVIRQSIPFKRSAKPLVLGYIAGMLLTDPKFNYAKGMDRYDQDSESPDLLYRNLVAGTYAAVMASAYYAFGQGGLNVADTLNTYADVMQRRAALDKLASSQGKLSILNRIERVKLGWIERGLARDSDFIVEQSLKYSDEAFSHLSEAEATTMHARSLDIRKKHAKFTPDNFTFDNLNPQAIDEIAGDNGYLKQLSGRLNGNNRFATRVSPTIISTRAVTTLIGLTIVTNGIRGFATEGGRSTRHTDWLIDNLQSGFGFKPISYFTSVWADVFRLVTGMDRSIPNEGPFGQPLRPGEPFGQSAQKIKYQKLVNVRNKDLQSSLDNIAKLIVLDEPNAFIGFFNIFGATFRSGETGDRPGFYMQLQSAGQDISTAVYSMSASFLFKEALAGRDDLALQIISAAKSGKDPREVGLGRLSQKDMRKAAVNLLSVTSHLQPLRERRKFSRSDDEVLSLIGGDALLAGAIQTRNRMLENISFQPPQSLVSSMLKDGVYKNQDVVSILTGYILGDNSRIHELFKDAFKNTRQNLNIIDVKFLKYEKTSNTFQSQSQTFVANDMSHWANQYSVMMSDKMGSGMFDNFGYFMSVISPFIHNWLAISGAVVATGIFTYIWGSSINYKTTLKNMEKEVDDYFRAFYTENGQRAEPDSPRTFTARRRKLFEGSRTYTQLAKGPVEVFKHKIGVHKGSSYFHLNNSLGTGDEFMRAVNDAFGRLELEIERSYLQEMYPGDMNFKDSMRNHTSRQVRGYAQSALGNKNRNDIINEIANLYAEQTDTLIDRYYSALDRVEVNLPSGGTIKLMYLLQDGDLRSFVNNADPILESMTNNRMGNYSNLVENRKADMRQVIVSILEHELNTNPNIHKLLIHNADVESAVVFLTEKVLSSLANSTTMKSMRHTLGGLGTAYELDFADSLIEQFNKAKETFYNYIPGRKRNYMPPTPDVDPITKASALSQSAEQINDSGQSLSKIKHKGSRLKGGNFVFSTLDAGMHLFDIFDTVNSISAFSRLANAQQGDFATPGELGMLKREAGMVVSNILIGLAVGAVGKVALSALALAGWWALPIIAGVVGAGFGAVQAFKWAEKKLGGPSNPTFNRIGEALSGAYYGVSDAFGEVLGEWLPSIGYLIGGKKGKSVVTGGLGWAVGAASLVTALMMGGLSTLTKMGAMKITAASFLTGGTLTGLAPEAMSQISSSVVSAVYQWKIGSFQIGALFADDPVETIYNQKRFRYNHPGSPIYAGTATSHISNEYKEILQKSQDYTGKESRSIFVNASLYGSSVMSGSYADIWNTGRPLNLMADGLISRELQIRAQMYNQTIVGKYRWRTIAAAAMNYRDFMKDDKVYQLVEMNKVIELLAATGGIKVRDYMKGGLSLKALQHAGVVNKIKELSNMWEEVKKGISTSYIATFSKSKVTAKQVEQVNLMVAIGEKSIPVVEKEIEVKPDEGVVTVSKVKATNNELKSVATGFLRNRVDVEFAHVM